MLAGEVLRQGRGLIYGIGHAVYTLSDPRAVLLKELARDLAAEKRRDREFEFMERLERCAIETVYEVKGRKKTLCANVDFLLRLRVRIIGLPRNLHSAFRHGPYCGWCAHRNEELNFEGKRIIRPAYRSVSEECRTCPSTSVDPRLYCQVR